MFIKPQAQHMANKRPHVISITVNAQELAECQALAKEADLPMTTMLRKLLRNEVAKQAKRQA
jgi:isoaspartyl peptidase/L-asparaginase-like protein (Ntn-hydrolase superfamily)